MGATPDWGYAMAAVETLVQMVNDPQVRDLLVGLSERYDARARVVNVVASDPG